MRKKVTWSHFVGGSNTEPICYFCEESEDHVATNGPRGTKIVQYFACRKFAEMSPNERFKELRRKGYCFQCLFPGEERIKENMLMGCVKGISYASIYHMTDFQEKNTYWYVMNIEMKRKIKISYKCRQMHIKAATITIIFKRYQTHLPYKSEQGAIGQSIRRRKSYLHSPDDQSGTPAILTILWQWLQWNGFQIWCCKENGR